MGRVFGIGYGNLSFPSCSRGVRVFSRSSSDTTSSGGSGSGKCSRNHVSSSLTKSAARVAPPWTEHLVRSHQLCKKSFSAKRKIDSQVTPTEIERVKHDRESSKSASGPASPTASGGARWVTLVLSRPTCLDPLSFTELTAKESKRRNGHVHAKGQGRHPAPP